MPIGEENFGGVRQHVGFGNIACSSIPLRIESDDSFRAVVTGELMTCAVTTDGELDLQW